MIRFYYHPTPNPMKVSLFLEETGLPYEVAPVDTRKGEQHLAAFRAINPNGKLPAIVDTDGGKEVRVFDSTAILLYLPVLHRGYLDLFDRHPGARILLLGDGNPPGARSRMLSSSATRRGSTCLPACLDGSSLSQSAKKPATFTAVSKTTTGIRYRVRTFT